MSSLFLPASVLMLITLLVWVKLFINRVSAAKAQGVHPQKMASPEQITAAFDAKTNAPANCFKNMFELPVLFYVLCGFITLAGTVDALYTNLAWAYVGLRGLHAIVHCTYNKVMHRFYAYLVSSLVLWAMVIRFFISAL